MSRAQTPDPPQPNRDVPDDVEPGALPVEPDQVPGPARLPDEDPKNRPALGRRVAAPPLGAKAPLSATGLALPHERDESSKVTADTPDPVIVQAKRDIDAGMVDTDMHATPGLDARLRARLVPGAGGKPPPSGG